MGRRRRRTAPPGLLDQPAVAKWQPWRSGLALFATIIAVPTIGLLGVDHIVHRDLEQRATAANSEVADQLAVTLGQAIDQRARLVVGASRGPGLLGTGLPAAGSGADLSASLAVLAADGGFCNAELIVSPTQTVSASTATPCAPAPGDPVPGPDGVGVLAARFAGATAFAGYQVAVPAAPGQHPVLRVTYALTGVAGPLRAPLGGTSMIVAGSGRVVQSSTPTQDGLQPQAAGFVAMARAHRAGSARLYAPTVGRTILFSYAPVPGTPYGAATTVPVDIAYRGADTLQRELWLGYGGFVGLAGAVAAGMTLLVRRRDLARAVAARRASALAELSPDGIAVLDPDRRVVYANQSLATLLHHDAPADMIGLPGTTWAGPDNRPPEADSAVAVGQAVTLHRLDGTPVPVETNAAPLDLDGKTGRLVVIRDMTERRRVELAMAAAEGRQRAILDTIPDGVVLYDLDDDGLPVPVMVNPAATEMLGLGLDRLKDWGFEFGLEILDEHGDALTRDEMPVRCVARTGQPLDGLVWGIRRDGRVRWLRSSTRPILDAGGTLTGVVTSLVDITGERAVHAEVAAAHARYAALIEHGSDLISVLDVRGRLRYLSPAHGRLFGWDDGWLGRRVDEAMHPDDRRAARAALSRLLSEPDAVERLSCRIRTVTGEYRHLDVTCTNRLADPWVNGVVTNSRDVTDEVEASELLRHQATHDPLTGLANRTLLLDRMERALVSGPCAVLFIDLDHFKRVNDTLGHAAGDELLEVIARRLQATLRPGDSVARVGGDEFVVLADGVHTSEAAAAIAARITDAITRPVRLSARTMTVGCSVGIALAHPSVVREPELVLQDADTALYQAKERGRNRAEVYDTAVRVRTQQRLDAEALVRSAIDDDKLAVVFQPVIDLSTGMAVGTEALARLNASDGGLIGPEKFIDAAEDSGLIVPLGAAILDMACAQQAEWNASGAALTQVSVNLSARQLGEPGLISGVAEVLDRHGLTAAHLCLELTESSLIDAGETSRRAISDLKAMGITLALDDFGTGWSSLAYLRRFPIDIIKIDRSFVSGLGVDNSDTEVVRAVIGLGRALGLTTVAEGVETPAQAQHLIQLGCHYAQGYFYGRPVPASKLGDAVGRSRNGALHAPPVALR
ncbi:EAL domain-containing protein [Acidiferrimicrobium sp. IK]|uniref:sensor domain-containing protein n=1 Tax=Acidiferrimicrobium sp. IK TaxID=2871700 RepID=UPI0021CB67C7|nr:bifunctional diguanylate cyclase/phosphodiesterase [Acidiferrimicrobium sp. IK]MCU4183135.1 EAL domain-containing protein [Acidiferrimicrobium sp. IK]